MEFNAFELGSDKDGDGCQMSLLGQDQVLAILQLLPIPCIVSMGLTCRRFHRMADLEELWMHVFHRDWGCVDDDNPTDEWGGGWKHLYRKTLEVGSVSWRRLPQGDTFPPPRASHSFNTISRSLFVFGGGYDGGRHLDDTWVASLPGEEGSMEGGVVWWKQASLSYPVGRFGQSCTAVRGGRVLVLFGGINDKGVRLCDTWVMSEEEEGRWVWRALEVLAAPPPRGAHAGCYGGADTVVIIGGIGSDGSRLADMWVLDLSAVPLCWREIVTMPSARVPAARSGHTLTWIGGRRAVLFGGRGTDFRVLNDAWILDLDPGKHENYAEWIQLSGVGGDGSKNVCTPAPVPTPRAGHSASLVSGGRVLIYGGEDSKRFRKGDVWLLDPRAAKFLRTSLGKFPRKLWKRLKQSGRLPTKRSFHGACPINRGDAVLVSGGMIDGELIPAAAAGLEFDADLFLLQLLP